jgi:hypothetical protein
LEEVKVHRGLECQKKKRKEIFPGKPEGEADPDIRVYSTLLSETQNRLMNRSNRTENRAVKNNKRREN